MLTSVWSHASSCPLLHRLMGDAFLVCGRPWVPHFLQRHAVFILFAACSKHTPVTLFGVVLCTVRTQAASRSPGQTLVFWQIISNEENSKTGEFVSVYKDSFTFKHGRLQNSAMSEELMLPLLTNARNWNSDHNASMSKAVL